MFSMSSLRSSHLPNSAQSLFAGTPLPPSFAMYMLIKDLQRSVVDRYANKGLSGAETELTWIVRCRALLAAPSTEILYSGTCVTNAHRGRSKQRPCIERRLHRRKSTPHFHHVLHYKKCIIMHFSQKSAANMHYNALFAALKGSAQFFRTPPAP
jgi:hypothetical protein